MFPKCIGGSDSTYAPEFDVVGHGSEAMYLWTNTNAKTHIDTHLRCGEQPVRSEHGKKYKDQDVCVESARVEASQNGAALTDGGMAIRWDRHLRSGPGQDNNV